MSPIPTRVYKPVTATPRQTSAMTLSGWMIWLLRTGASRRDLSLPYSITREPGNRSVRKYKSELKRSRSRENGDGECRIRTAHNGVIHISQFLGCPRINRKLVASGEA